MRLFSVFAVSSLTAGVWASCDRQEQTIVTRSEHCTVSNNVISCPDGTTMEIPSGLAGENGKDGIDGLAGSSCTVESAENGALVLCENGTAVLINNGTPGEPGRDGEDYVPPTTLSIPEIITPCPNNPYPEVLLRIGGTILAHYSAGNKQHLAVLKPGTYTTTQNGGDCNFAIDPDMTVRY